MALRVAIFTIATVTSSCSDSFPLSFPFGLVCECVTGQSFPISHYVFLQVLAMWWVPIIKLSIVTAISSFVVETRRTIFFSRWTFALSFGHIALLRNCLVQQGFLIEFLCRSLSLPCHVQKNMFRHSSTRLLTSVIVNLCLFLQLLSKSLLLLLDILSAPFSGNKHVLRLLLEHVNLWQNLGSLFRTMSR